MLGKITSSDESGSSKSSRPKAWKFIPRNQEPIQNKSLISSSNNFALPFYFISPSIAAFLPSPTSFYKSDRAIWISSEASNFPFWPPNTIVFQRVLLLRWPLISTPNQNAPPSVYYAKTNFIGFSVALVDCGQVHLQMPTRICSLLFILYFDP